VGDISVKVFFVWGLFC